MKFSPKKKKKILYANECESVTNIFIIVNRLGISSENINKKHFVEPLMGRRFFSFFLSFYRMKKKIFFFSVKQLTELNLASFTVKHNKTKMAKKKKHSNLLSLIVSIYCRTNFVFYSEILEIHGKARDTYKQDLLLLFLLLLLIRLLNLQLFNYIDKFQFRSIVTTKKKEQNKTNHKSQMSIN